MKNKNYLLYGMGKTNSSVKEFFLKNNISFSEYVDGIGEYDLNNIDIIVKSPGIKFDTPLLVEANNKKIQVVSDLELFYLFYPKAKLIVITGTNGKTSTARMLSIILSKKYKCYLGGNIGLPLFSLNSSKSFKNELVIVEASSFMLEHCKELKPFIYVITSFASHHLDYHKTIENYFHAKVKIINNLDDAGILLVPSHFKDLNLTTNKTIYFDERGTSNLVRIDQNKLKVNDKIINSFKTNQIVPKHQLVNMSIVCEIALFLEISEERIRKGFEDVSCEKYRLQVIYNDLNTIIINDAKSTNQAASLAAIESLKDIEYDIHWILGGHGSTNDLISNTNSYVKKYYLYGENKDELEKDLQEFHNEYSKYNFLEEVIESIKNDDSKKVILYSPAAQSYDQYDNFEQRGEHFNSLVNKYWHN